MEFDNDAAGSVLPGNTSSGRSMASFQLDHCCTRAHEPLEQFPIKPKVAVVSLSPPRPPALPPRAVPTLPPRAVPPLPPRASVADTPDGGPLDLRREEHRLRTLRHWPAKFLSSEVAARSGLYYFGDRDTLRCHFCGVELSQWKEGDDVEADHGRWSPACPLLLRRPTENVPAGRDECGVLAASVPPAHPAFMTEAARLATFGPWPVRMRQTPAALADAGFYYTGNGDQTVCYHCGGGLKDWEDDDEPWEQHALWFDRCPYVRAMRGEDFVRRVRHGEPCAAPPGRPPAPSPPSSPPPPPQRDYGKSPASSAALEGAGEGSKADSERLCKICFNSEYNVCFVPCGHVLACMKCAMSVTNCPLCRKPHTGIVKLFYS